MTHSKVQPDPIFAAIRAHKNASNAHARAHAERNVLLDKIKESEKYLSGTAIRASKPWATLWLGNAWHIENALQAKRHIACHLAERAHAFGPKTAAKIKQLRRYALREIMVMLSKREVEHEQQRRKLGLEAVHRAEIESAKARNKTFDDLCKTRPTTVKGLSALIEYVRETADGDGFSSDYATARLLRSIGASLKKLAHL